MEYGGGNEAFIVVNESNFKVVVATGGNENVLSVEVGEGDGLNESDCQEDSVVGHV
jgi:hypothetical protein